ncbi:hypothetical protein DFH09DRAFT_1113849 [Mycena vulgaris]|nr:hypothetical protein DFH09DRAFT_1113849 [Mycena vulgaris]
MKGRGSEVRELILAGSCGLRSRTRGYAVLCLPHSPPSFWSGVLSFLVYGCARPLPAVSPPLSGYPIPSTPSESSKDEERRKCTRPSKTLARSRPCTRITCAARASEHPGEHDGGRQGLGAPTRLREWVGMYTGGVEAEFEIGCAGLGDLGLDGLGLVLGYTICPHYVALPGSSPISLVSASSYMLKNTRPEHNGRRTWACQACAQARA